MPDGASLARARSAGLLPGTPLFKDVALQRALAFRVRRAEPAEITPELVCGLGELTAWSHADLRSPLARAMRRVRPAVDVGRLLDGAMEALRHRRTPPRRADLLHPQWLVHRVLTWDTLQAAASSLDRHYDFGAGPHHGFRFAARLALDLDPDRCARWVAKGRPLEAVRLVVGRVMDVLAVASRESPLVNAMLRARAPALRAIGVAAVVSDANGGARGSLREDFLRFRECGIPAVDAHWLAASRLRTAAGRRSWREEQKRDVQARLWRLRSDPQAATGGARNAPGELARLEAERDSLEERLRADSARIDGLLTELAACWPDRDLRPPEIERIGALFADSPELRYAAAEKLPAGASRSALLDQNRAAFAGLIGLRSPNAAFEDYFFADPERVFREMRTTAASLALRWSGDPKSLGKRTAHEVAGLAGAALALLRRPFAATRFPRAYQSALGRYACAVLLAFAVVDRARAAGRPGEVDGLLRLALDNVEEALCHTRDDESASAYVDQLPLAAVAHMAGTPQHDRRGGWCRDARFPPYARALAMWSDADLVRAELGTARRLFIEGTRPRLVVVRGDSGLGRALTLLDLAAATAAADGSADVVSELRGLWRTAGARFGPRHCDTDLGTLILDAAGGGDEARDRLLAHSGLSRCLVTRLRRG